MKALRCAVSVGVFLLFFPCVRYLGQHTLALEVATSLFMALRRWGMGDGERWWLHLRQGDLMGDPFLFLAYRVLGVYFYVGMCIRSRIEGLPHCSMNSSYGHTHVLGRKSEFVNTFSTKSVGTLRLFPVTAVCLNAFSPPASSLYRTVSRTRSTSARSTV